MAKGEIEVKKSDTVRGELELWHQAISRRAYDLSLNGNWDDALTDWLRAERELASKPAVELRQRNGQFEVSAALPGIDAKDIDLQVSPEDVLIKVETTAEKRTDKGTVHMSELTTGRMFRSIRLPERIDPHAAKAQFTNGMLQVTVAIVKTRAAKKVAIKAA